MRLPRSSLVSLGLLLSLGCGKPPSSAAGADEAEPVEAKAKADVGAAVATTNSPAPANEAEATELTEVLRFPEVELVDHQGRAVSFHRDLVEGKVVVINFIFTTCGMICPPMGANFAALDEQLAEDKSLDVRLVSVTVDPTTDTPERLARWKERFSDTDRWTLVTGPKPEVDRLLKALRAFTPDRQDHSPMVLVGNDATGRWMRANGLAQARLLADVVRDVAGKGVQQ